MQLLLPDLGSAQRSFLPVGVPQYSILANQVREAWRQAGFLDPETDRLNVAGVRAAMEGGTALSSGARERWLARQRLTPDAAALAFGDVSGVPVTIDTRRDRLAFEAALQDGSMLSAAGEGLSVPPAAAKAALFVLPAAAAGVALLFIFGGRRS